jgi:uncharacterized membrane protein YtjA (UPF0391 family)
LHYLISTHNEPAAERRANRVARLASGSGVRRRRTIMGTLLWLGIVFLVIAILAYALGARGVAGMSAGVGRTLLFVFLVLAVIFAIVGIVNHA